MRIILLPFALLWCIIIVLLSIVLVDNYIEAKHKEKMIRLMEERTLSVIKAVSILKDEQHNSSL